MGHPTLGSSSAFAFLVQIWASYFTLDPLGRSLQDFVIHPAGAAQQHRFISPLRSCSGTLALKARNRPSCDQLFC